MESWILKKKIGNLFHQNGWKKTKNTIKVEAIIPNFRFMTKILLMHSIHNRGQEKAKHPLQR